MRIADFARTSGFRIGLMFLGLFGAASLALFAFIYHQSAGYMVRSTDAWLRHEVVGRVADTSEQLLARLRGRRAADPGQYRPFALFAPDRRLIAGNLDAMPDIPALDRPFEFRTRKTAGKPVGYRAMAHDMGGGRTLIIAEDVDELEDFSERLVHALVIGGAVMVALGIGGAVILGAIAAHRIDEMRAAIERVIGGDLARRLPTGSGRSDVDRLALVVNVMLDELERLVDEVKGVCDNIAHDMRTPLSRLLAGLERARRRNEGDAALGTAIDYAIAEGRSILQMFGAILRISEIEDGMRRSGFCEMDLVAVAADAVDYHAPSAGLKAIDLQLEAPASLPMRGDPGLLFEAIGNLLDNAIKFTPAGGQVRLDLREGPTIRVGDSGPGIAAAERKSVLGRFTRGDASRSVPGNGLGLALVAAIARLHGFALSIGDAAPGCVVILSSGATRTLSTERPLLHAS